LRAARTAERPLYPRTETHWNDLGAYVAFRLISERLAHWYPSVRRFSLDELKVTPLRSTGGDLARLLGLPELPGEYFIITPPQPPVAREVLASKSQRDDMIETEDHRVTERTGAPIGRAVIFHDSFARMMVPYLSELFDHAVYRWSHDFDFKMVEEECPDVVIFEFVERILTQWRPSAGGAKQALAKVATDRVCHRGAKP
jgi:alginate O-acetyltransferase complex protein AlgJ